MRNAGLDEAQAGIKIARRNITNLRYVEDTTLMAENEEELKSLLVKVERVQWKSLKYNSKKIKIMAFSPITSWQIEGEKVKGVTDFIFLDFKITTHSDYSHEVKRCLFLGRKAMINVDSILESRDITLLTKVHIIKAEVFPIVMYRCES